MTSFGKYQVVEQMGEGGLGGVYRGWDPALKRPVAIKVASLTAPQARERFMREAEIAANLRHPHIVTIFDFGEEDGQPYLVQEFLPGKDLDELIRAGAVGDLRVRIRFLTEAAEALQHAHSRGVVHRDVKPGNLRIVEDGSLRVMDFGIAKVLDAHTDLTATGMSIGTSGYLAPEQLEGLAIDHRADIFSFGVVAYELLTSKKPFAGDTITAVLYRILNEEPAAIATLAPDTPARLAACIDRCLRKRPEERYADLSEVIAELRAVTAELDGATPAPPPPFAAPSPPFTAEPGAKAAQTIGTAGDDRSIRLRKLGVVAAALAVVAVGIWALVSVVSALTGGPEPGAAAGDSVLVAAAGDSALDSARTDSAAALDSAAAGAGDVATGSGDPARTGAAAGGRSGASADPGAGAAARTGGAGSATTGSTAGSASGGATGAGTGGQPAAGVTAVDPDRVVVLLQGEVPAAVRLAETTLLAELTARGRPVVEQADVTEAQAAAAARRAAAPGEARPLAALGRELGAGTVVVGTLLVDATPTVAGIVTGSAVLDVRFYDSVTGALILADKFQIGAGGVPGRAGSSELDAISQAAEAVARQAARAVVLRTGSRR